MRPLNVVIFEKDASNTKDLEIVIPKLFSEIGYQANVIPTTTVAAVEEKILRDNCHVLFSDLTFGTDWAVGLDHIKALKSKYPDIFVIACSGDQPNIAAVTQRAPHTFDIFAPKYPLINATSEVWMRVQEAFERHFRVATNLDVSVPASVRSIKVDHPDEHATLSEREICALVRQCLWSGPNRDTVLLPDKAHLSALGGGRSGSLVAEVRLSVDAEDLAFIPVVLKVSPIERAQLEYANFQRYVKLILPYPWRIDVIGYGETRDWGAIAYSFAFGQQLKYKSLTDFLETGRGDIFTKVVDHIFGSAGNIWYNEKFRASAERLSQFYLAKYFSPEYRREACVRGFSSYLNGLGIEIGATEIIINQATYPVPERALFGRFRHGGTTTICHGDLNANNIMVARNGNQITFIDFQDTGRGHVFEDFVALESSARLYFKIDATENISLGQLIEAEAQLKVPIAGPPARGIAKRLPYRDLVIGIRKRAQAAFPSVPLVEYTYALAVFHYRLMRLRDLSAAQKARAAACLFSALKDLEESDAFSA
jgi:hypothetical protein